MGKPAARVGDMHTCPMVTGVVPHVGGPVLPPGCPTVLIGFMPAARMGDMATCVGPPDSIVMGSPTVFIGGQMAARVTDPTVHGGLITLGCFTVFIGEAGSGGAAPGSPAPPTAAFKAASESGTALVCKGPCEACGQLGPEAPPAAAPEGGAGAAAAPEGGAGAAAAAAAPAAKKGVDSGLGDGVDALVEKSPTLKSNVEQLQKDGWTIEYGEAGKGTYADKTQKKIVVDSNKKGDDEGVARSLAHESGHAMYQEEPYVPPAGLTKEQYVEKNVQRHLKDEGEATLTNAQVRNEIKENGGPDIGISGAQSEKYAKIAEKYPDPKDRDKARQEIADVFAEGEHPSTDPSKTYEEYYAKTYADFYDKNPPAKK